ncbi:glycoside hydrolase, partial [Gymnopus androsaceus JB14]
MTWLWKGPVPRFLLLAVLFVGSPKSCLALDNGLAVTPAMGWNPYNAFSCTTVQSLYHTQAQALVSLGLDTLGYNYFNLDCGWQGTERNSTGGFTWSTTAIPDGIPALVDFVHNLGLKFGVYSDGPAL